MPTRLTKSPGSEHEIFHWGRGGDTCLGTLMIPVLNSMPAISVASLMGTDWTWLKPGEYVEPNIIHGSSVLTLARNEAVQRMNGDWLMFIDDDMVWQPDAIKRLIQTREEFDLDILGGLCFRRSEPFQPTLYMREQADSGAYNFLERWDSDIVEVDATGCAFVVIHKRVFEKIIGSPMPPREERMKIGPPPIFRWEGTLGEDLRFCQDAKKAGCRIFVDTRIEVGHVAEQIITKRDFWMQLATRPDEVMDERRRINSDMGLPTVEKEEALESLRS